MKLFAWVDAWEKGESNVLPYKSIAVVYAETEKEAWLYLFKNNTKDWYTLQAGSDTILSAFSTKKANILFKGLQAKNLYKNCSSTNPIVINKCISFIKHN